jgi:eukaryotic-like serine/threonine-protein kinase
MKYFRSVIFSLAVILLISCKSNPGQNAAFFHADATHSGYYNTRGVPEFHGVAWRYKTGGRVFSSPVISEGALFIGSDDSSFYSLDAKDGSLLWKFRTGGRVSSSAAIFNGKVYLSSFDGYLYCLDQHSGKELWKFATSGERVFAAPGIHGIPEKDRDYNDPWDMFLSSPVIAHGNVYVGCGTGSFYAVDCNSGQLKWQVRSNGVIHSSPAYADSTIYFGSWDSYLYAVNAINGEVKWKFKTGTDTVYYNQVGFQSSPVIYKGIVYSGCRDAHVWAIDAKTGRLKWQFYNNGSWVIVTPAVHNDTLYFTTSDTHKLIALNALDGKMLYTGNCKTFGFSSPAVTNGLVYLGNFGGSLMAFKTNNGEPAWEFRTEEAVADKDSILTDKGEFIFPKIFKENTYKASLAAVNLLYSVGSILSSPAVNDGTVYFGSTDGFVYALH